MSEEAILWLGGLRGRAAWVLEWKAPPSAGRLVLIAADTTDSRAGADPAPLNRLFSWIALALRAGDECALWQLGHPRPVARKSFTGIDQSHCEDFARHLRERLKSELGGSWLAPTLKGMLEAADSGTRSGRTPFILLATDGEIFDLEALPRLANKTPVGWVRLPGASDELAAKGQARLDRQCQRVVGSASGVAEFLTTPARRLGFQATDSEPDLKLSLSKDGEPTGFDPFGREPSPSHLAVCWLGARRPVFHFTLNDRPVAIVEKPLPSRVPRALQRVLSELAKLTIPWSLDRLARLAAALGRDGDPAPSGEPFVCGDECRSQWTAAELQESLFCRKCGRLLVAEDHKSRADLRPEDRGLWTIGLRGDGSVEEPKRGSGKPSARACRVVRDDHGIWLELNLDLVVYV